MYKRKSEKTDWWWCSWYISEYSKFALYKYDDDNTTLYLSDIFVDPKYREQKIGNEILSLAENKAKKLKVKYLMLWCLKDSWMHNWYSRHSFVDLCDVDDNPKYIWMEK